MCLCPYASCLCFCVSVPSFHMRHTIISHETYHHTLCLRVTHTHKHTIINSNTRDAMYVCLRVSASVCLCVCVCMCVCVCVYVLLCLCVYASVSGVLCVCVCMCLCVYVSVFLSHDISERGCKIMSMCLCVCVCMCLCFCVAVCLPCMSVQHHTLQYTATALQPHRNTMHSATHCSILQHTTLVYV